MSTAIQEISAKQDGLEKNSKDSFIKLEEKIEKLKEELNSNFESKLELQYNKIKDLFCK